VVVAAIYSFCLHMQPSSAELVVGCHISRKSVGRIYRHLRLAVQAYNTKHHRGRMGGKADEGESGGVQIDGELRRVVEYDESGLCVCVCMCVCVFVCIAISLYSLKQMPSRTHTHTHHIPTYTSLS
jgi:hypothetical protein